MRNTVPSSHRGSTRESKRTYLHRISTINDKLRRHRRKARIWRRAVKRLAHEVTLGPGEASLA